MPSLPLKSVLFVLLITATVCSQQVDLRKDIQYAKVGDHRLLLDLYLPAGTSSAEADAKPNLIVWVHGGAWRRGSKSSMPLGWLLDEGFAIASVDYRLSPVARFPAQVHDCKAAIRFLRGNANRYGYDARRIGIAGSSAGGHLVALVGATNGLAELEGDIGEYTGQSSSVEAVVDYYGPTNFLTILKQSTPHGLGVRIPALQLLLGNQPENVPELAKLASPVFHVDRSDPPLLIIHGDQDPQVPINQSHELHAKWKEHDLNVNFEVVHGGLHGGEGFFDGRRRAMVGTFFATHLQSETPAEDGEDAGSKAAGPSADKTISQTDAGNAQRDNGQLDDGQLGNEQLGDAQLGTAVASLAANFCLDCHSGEEASSQFDLESILDQPIDANVPAWEKIVRKLHSRQMPPMDAARPDESEYDTALSQLQRTLDQIAARDIKPGRTETFRRLTRIEYQHAIRDLLAIKIDASSMLPKDESSQGFDNITVGELSPTLLNRYVSAAQKIARLAVGRTGRVPNADTFRVKPDITQERHLDGLPLGTRGGVSIPYNFPRDGEYEIRVRLARDRNEEVEGLNGSYELEMLLDKASVGSFPVQRPPKGSRDHSKVDQHLTQRMNVSAGPHNVGVTFWQASQSLLETKRQPYQSRFNYHRHPRSTPAVYQVTITGPFDSTGSGVSPSRQLVFGAALAATLADADAKLDPQQEEDVARDVLGRLARLAWRGPVDEVDLQLPFEFFQRGRAEAGFEAGIEMALSAILVNPRFLFRVEMDPPELSSDAVYRITDLELASRLSFFLWSSIPDDELLSLAEAGRLRQAGVLETQVRRMLADPRSEAMVTNFAGQWLYLRNLESVHPDMRLFPDFDDNLRQAMRRETELYFESIVREDRSVLDLLQGDYTFLNERLAKHYGIPHVFGSRFRRVALTPDSHRGGLLRHASILTVTSYATRTSPVIRGHWILKNLIGNPPPPPPPDVPDLQDNTVEANLPLRERLAQHRADPNCAVCHDVMDPVGFALENYDAIGRWRDLEAGLPVDASGGLPDGSKFDGVVGLEQGLLERPELFAGTLAEKLLTYALGRGVNHYDAAAVRRVVRDARSSDYRFSSLILGIVNSAPFQMRTVE